jgi:hypothetical protein
MINTHLSITIIDKTVCKTLFINGILKDMTKNILNLLGFENEINQNLKMKSKNNKLYFNVFTLHP